MAELLNLPLFGDANLAYYCRFEGNSNDSKSTNNGTDTNMSYSAASGKYGQGGTFNGTSSKIAIADNNALDLDTGNFSIPIWINPSSVTGTRHFISKLVDGNNYYEFKMISGVIQFDSFSSSVRRCQVFGTQTLQINTQYQITVVVDRSSASNTKMYVNGINDTAGTPTVSATTLANAAALWVGLDQFGGGQNFYSGGMDELAIFKRTLTQGEVLSLVNPLNTGSIAYFM